MTNYFIALLLTIAIEFLFLAFLIKKEIIGVLKFTFLINSITLPIATFIYNSYGNFLFVEGLVIFVESIFITGLFEINFLPALKISFAANLITALLTLLRLF